MHIRVYVNVICFLRFLVCLFLLISMWFGSGRCVVEHGTLKLIGWLNLICGSVRLLSPTSLFAHDSMSGGISPLGRWCISVWLCYGNTGFIGHESTVLIDCDLMTAFQHRESNGNTWNTSTWLWNLPTENKYLFKEFGNTKEFIVLLSEHRRHRLASSESWNIPIWFTRITDLGTSVWDQANSTINIHNQGRQ